MKICIIFGAGYLGQCLYYKIKNEYDIIYVADNNNKLWNTEMCGCKIINPDTILSIKWQNIIIASTYCKEIAYQLEQMGILEFQILKEGFLFEFKRNKNLCPFQEPKTISFSPNLSKEISILFVQPIVCVRTMKIAAGMKQLGVKTTLAYTIEHPLINSNDVINSFEEIVTINSVENFIEAVKKSDFDIIHSSNEPDYLTRLLVTTNKKIVHDVHDLTSIYSKVTIQQLLTEHIANTQSEGVIYTSNGAKEIAKRKFDLDTNKIFVLENLMSNLLSVENRYSKLSEEDGAFHCVYVGGISEDKKSFRYFEDIWNFLIREKIHIHYYSGYSKDYCLKLQESSPYYHYEGKLSPKELASEMTKYDCGLVLLNITSKNKMYLETSSPNKLYEYLNSGIPVIVGNIESHKDFVEKYNVGIQLNYSQEIKPQIAKVRQIHIDDNFLEKNSLTMQEKCVELLRFYKTIINT